MLDRKVQKRITTFKRVVMKFKAHLKLILIVNVKQTLGGRVKNDSSFVFDYSLLCVRV
jgi:hypothetical protein